MKRFLFFFFLIISAPVYAKMKIVATYPPVQSLVLQITDGVYPVNLLHKKGGQHHDVQLKPSQLKVLQNADIVFWIGDDLENYMQEALEKIAPQALSVPLIENDQLHLKQSISNPDKPDVHFWLDVNNVLVTLDKIEQIMIEKDPKNKDKFMANKKKAVQYLQSLSEDAKKIPANRKFIALHDGFDYFFDYFHLNGITLGVEPENLQTPQQIYDFKMQIQKENPDCIIVEPSLTRREKSGLDLNKYALQKADAFGWNINNDPAHLYKMMRWNIEQLSKCSK